MILIFENIPVGPLQCNCYILGCENTREALVIDPGDEIELILPSLEKHQLNVRYILSTHAHIDHVGDLEKLKDKTGAKTLLHEKDLYLYENLPAQADYLGLSVPTTTEIDHFIHQDDQITFGDQSTVSNEKQTNPYCGNILFTPGHTPGSLCIHFPENGKLFAGDTLFQMCIGRTDLWGGSYNDIIQSIQNHLLVLEDDTIVYPGHGPPTTIGKERQYNPFLNNRR